MNSENTEVAVKERNDEAMQANNLFRTAGMPDLRENLPANGVNLPEQNGNANKGNYGNGNYYGDNFRNNQGGYQYNNGYDQFSDYNGMTEYPTLKCKSAAITFWNVCFPGIFAFGFMGGPLMATLTALRGQGTGIWLFMSIFFIIGAVSAGIAIFNLVKYFLVMRKGKRISGIVCGYEPDNVIYNNRPGQIAKILLDTPVGKRYIMYKLGNATQPYAINSRVSLMAYKNYFKVMDNDEKIDW